MFYSLNCRGKLLSLDRVRLMGILNVTPDSFSDGGEFDEPERAVAHALAMREAGADIIDIGGYSSRPFADDISVEEEFGRIAPVLELLLKEDVLVSVDTFRAGVARQVLEMGTHIINDIGAGNLSEGMMEVVATFGVPYILMHMQGNPQTMQLQPTYENVVEDVWSFLVAKIGEAQKVGIRDVVADVGFGFGKSIDHNFELFRNLGRFALLDVPMLVGVSRKSMLYKFLGTSPKEVKEATAVLHVKAMEAGAKLLRVHDVKETKEVLRLYEKLYS